MIPRLSPIAATLADLARNAATTINLLAGRLEAPQSIDFVPGPLPASPAKGVTVYDEADDIVKTWDGTAWQPHW